MPSYVAFLRAVNVGGRNVKMADLRAALTDAGFTDVATHIQSGNVRVRTSLRSPQRVAASIRESLTAAAGFDIPAIVRTPAELTALVGTVDAIPALLPGEGRRYVAFADGPVGEAAQATLEGWSTSGERALVLGSDIMAELTVGFHKTTLTNARIERITGRMTTWRDLKVLRQVTDLWGGSTS